MDYLREIEKIEKPLTVRQIQDIDRITPKAESSKYPYKNTMKKSTGEYFATLEDKINLVRYMAEHPTVPPADKNLIRERLA